jgi:small-conductance mechanosensitive channel
MLAFPGGVRTALLRAVIVVLLLQAGLWASALVVALLKEYQSRNLETDPAAATTIGALVFIGRLIVWTLVFVIALDNLGVDITALVTGLGIGGIAVALAVQNVLGDLLASLSIVLDKPFVVGDFLAVDDLLGSVEDVGLRTTRLRSLSGEQLVFSNTDLLKSRVRNFGRMYERRILFGIGVTYDTPREKLQRIPGILREAVESQEKVRFDRAHFKAFGPYSLDFEVVYYVTVPDYGAYMDVQQAVNFRIHERFEEAGIEFAFPTQTLHLVRPDAAGTEA